jgi:hypothetical protein
VGLVSNKEIGNDAEYEMRRKSLFAKKL